MEVHRPMQVCQVMRAPASQVRTVFHAAVSSNLPAARRQWRLSAAAPRGPPTAQVRSSGKVQLAFQDCRCLGEQLLLQDFHDANPNIEVFYTPEPEDYAERMLADMQAGVAPDVFAGCCDTFPIWAQQGYLLDLHPFVESDLPRETIDDWDQAQYRSFFTAAGVQFALPKYHGALALYYNKDIFDDYAFDYPTAQWSHEDYLLAMQRIKEASAAAGKTNLWGSMFDVSWERIQVHVNGWNGHFVDPENAARSWMSRPEALTAMEWLRARMWDDRVMASRLDVANANTRDAFIRENLAMVEEGSWALRDILEQAKFRIGVAPFPAGPAVAGDAGDDRWVCHLLWHVPAGSGVGTDQVPGWE